ncbi:lipid-binding/transfer protein [Theileria orientalis strain Shintoku]|uniref:Lipid-binding/transfer protein n=1 Tax=Theileria orientalis strain Shintoku TaxID=869250 RepID=J7MGV6_THEOR|nr:lipid-binding/transfer protein [Theileria orientalis strain Shintoku]PVC53109.1 lipid-binding/transfer protein [Theileria orientalis]BAM42311.1 lipid-binding/transfer protein [Theileria orientalis strain Shintoku]|eukprot:XP_009692612.1 lipid-binding/transfer protein [Theileria orientalis strain Shintoku]
MFQVVKNIISSVSIDPSSNSESTISDSDTTESDLALAMEGSLKLKENKEKEKHKDPGSKTDVPRKEVKHSAEKEDAPEKTHNEMNKSNNRSPRHGFKTKEETESKLNLDVPDSLPNQAVDEYLNEFLVSIVHRFYEHKTFDEYTKVRDYNFGKTKLELLNKFRDTSSNLKEFIVNGVIDVPMENLLALVMELSNRTMWDDTYLEHTMLSYDEPTKTDFIHSVSKYPFPLTKRTYTITRTCYSYGEDCLVILSSTTDKMQAPKKFKWATQVDQFESMLVVRNCEPELVNGEKKVTKSYMLATYFENPKVLLPNSYLNFIIGQLVPGILSKMVIASKKFNYEESVKYVKTMNLVPMPRSN